MNYISEIIIVRNVNGKTTTETIRKEFTTDSTVVNRRNAIEYIKGLEASFQLAQEQGVEEFQERSEVADFKNFNTLIKSLTCIHSTGTVELINRQFMDDFDHTAITIDALVQEMNGFCREIINTGEEMALEIGTVTYEGDKFHVFAEDIEWLFEVNKCNG